MMSPKIRPKGPWRPPKRPPNISPKVPHDPTRGSQSLQQGLPGPSILPSSLQENPPRLLKWLTKPQMLHKTPKIAPRPRKMPIESPLQPQDRAPQVHKTLVSPWFLLLFKSCLTCIFLTEEAHYVDPHPPKRHPETPQKAPKRAPNRSSTSP